MRLAALVTAALALFGCAADVVIEPESGPCTNPRTFHVVSDRWHTGLVVQREDLIAHLPTLADDFEGAKMLEVGWGDAQFYQAKEGNDALALRAIAWPTDAVVHVFGVREHPSVSFRNSQVIELKVSNKGYERLVRILSETFARNGDERTRRLGPGHYGTSYFYSATGTFHAFNTCNTWAARTIAASGYPLADTSIITADSLLSQLRATEASGYDCANVNQ